MSASCEVEFMEYVDEESIDPNLVCNICHKPLKDPVSTSCDHIYGSACINHWLTSSIHYSCPTCQKQPLLITELVRANRLVRNILDDLRVRCTLCEESGMKRGNFHDHITKVCPKAVVECQAADIKCPWKGKREELDNHVSTCIFEPLRPVLGSLITENRQLTDQVQKHDKEIKNLTQRMSQMSSRTVVDDSGDESDTPSVMESSAGDKNQKEENAIFIRNLPASVKFNDIFDAFKNFGRIKYNQKLNKAEIFIFKNPNQQNGFCSAKVVYTLKESAAAAVAACNGKPTAPWNIRLLVSISESKRRNVNDFGNANNEGNAGAQSEATGTERREFELVQAPLKTNTRRHPRNSGQDGKPTD